MWYRMTALSVPTASKDPSKENFTQQTTLVAFAMSWTLNVLIVKAHTRCGYKPNGDVHPSDGEHQG